MVNVFGEVAALYDDVRPGYPDAVREMIVDYGGAPATILELGAGTGKGTELLLGLNAPLTALEPDPRMAAVLRAKFPTVEVVEAAFEEWLPPYGKPGLIACAMAWHWMDAATRNRRACDALGGGGVLAVFQHKYGYADRVQEKAISDVLTRVDPTVAVRGDHWVRDDVLGSGVWRDVEERRVLTYPVFSKERYLQLTRTFSPFLRHTPDDQRRALEGLDAAIDGFGGSVTLELRTSLVLARKGRPGDR
ncbi:methyltransferase domain-containing protein [Actinoplanes sp. LDG1-06]|uniref:Methyltransferase domain-containing protein n=1 Tax=Paractinoplanes ovalisporus TaxID=2810368 RepID=A0ABS2ARM3_9ACTN|nr:class I SAM-dependent methyltransferase [Actinoplanes ovalisporus]MBM2622490.1 methyltransferase domain-containing protein [Actinoplanes ovalisporus]